MADRIEEIVTGLEHLETVTAVCDLAERRLAEGDPSFLADLGIALTKRYHSRQPRVWQYSSVVGFLLRLLTCAPGAENVEQVLRLTAGGGDRRRARYVASLLAAGQAPPDLAVVFAGGSSGAGASDELRTCLVHELALRGRPAEATPGLARWTSLPHWSYHPLGWLPLSLTDLEGQPALPRYGVRSTSYPSLDGLPDGPGMRADRGGRVVASTETTTDSATSAIATAVANWADESNGRIEARVYELAEEVNADAVTSVLRSLGLECLRGLRARGGFVYSCPPMRVWQALFAAASTGGAYNAGAYGAYGRLAAWRSVAALAGSPAEATPADVEHLAHRCAWYRFDTATDWFEQVAWDLGLAVVNPDRRRLAILAATDTD